MKKTRQPSSAQAGVAAEEKDEALADRLVALSIELREVGIYDDLPEELQKAQSVLRKTIGKCLQQRREQALDEALERCYEEDDQAYRVLREYVDDMSGTILVRREGVSDLEVNAFVIPLFVRTQGGLNIEQCFQDEQAFEQLRDSIQEGGLESRKANVVLVSHAYHLDELDRIGYCDLNRMVHESYEAMTRKKAAAAEAIASSMRGWPASNFAPGDEALELRFLLGFALKQVDDAFYQVPAKEAAADRYFEARAERFRKWSQQVQPLLRRSLVNDDREVQIDFLYQDLFHGGREAARAELALLELLSEVQQTLADNEWSPADVQAVIGPTEADDDAVIRVSLRSKSGNAEPGVIDKALNRLETVEAAVTDIADGLASVGIMDLQVTRRFDIDGEPNGVRPYARMKL